MGGLKYTTEIFKQKLSESQPNLVLLNECNSSMDRVVVKCIIHDYTYEAGARSLVGKNSCGCKKCADDFQRASKNMGKDEFVRRANELHNNKYDYSLVEYVNTMTKVQIICPHHGSFWAFPGNHLKPQGCPDCKGALISKNSRDTTEIFIEKANKKYDNFYDYSKVDYVSSYEPVCIICPNHGEFWAKPNYHLRGTGCLDCTGSKLEKFVSGILVKNNITFTFEYRPNWLGKKSIDFYLPDYNIGIECQGKQHFEEREFFGGLKGFQDTIKWDVLKNKECIENDIKLFYLTDQTQFKNIMIESEIFQNIYNKENTICAGHKSKIPLKTLFIEFLNKQGIKTKN